MPAVLTPNCGIPRGWNVDEGGWDVGDDLGRQIIDCLLLGAVKSQVATLPSSGQAAGDVYLLTAGAAAHANEIAMWLLNRAGVGGWVYLVPKPGLEKVVVDIGQKLIYDAGQAAWIRSIINARVQVITNATGSVALDWSKYDEIRLTLTGNVALTMAGATDGQGCILKLKQDATGGRTVTLPAVVRYNALVPTYDVSPTALMADKLGLIYDGSDNKYDLVSLTPGML